MMNWSNLLTFRVYHWSIEIVLYFELKSIGSNRKTAFHTYNILDSIKQLTLAVKLWAIEGKWEQVRCSITSESYWERKVYKEILVMIMMNLEIMMTIKQLPNEEDQEFLRNGLVLYLYMAIHWIISEHLSWHLSFC